MKHQLHPIAAAAAAALALFGAIAPAQVFAQAAVAPPAPASAAASPPPEVQKVEVTGLRASLEASLAKKRSADSVVEVVTADDIGKLPDKNVADALQRVPGVNIASSAGGEGGFSENDRVSIRGTSPSLTQTLVNGHMISSGDWFVLDQEGGSLGRSVSYALMPSEILASAVVHKSATADLVEGGVAGAVDLITRRPLDFHKQLTVEATAQAIYSDLSAKTDPQANALVAWKNEGSTFGALLQVFSETRHERRDGQEIFGYGAIDPTWAAAVAHPDLAGVNVPAGINSALFEQTRKRQGGLVDLQLKPTANVTLDLNGFYSHLSASNYNRSFYNQPLNNLSVGLVPSSYKVVNNTLVQATFDESSYPVPSATPDGDLWAKAPATVDQIFRPGASATSSYLDLSGEWRVTDMLKLSGTLGETKGEGKTPRDIGYEADFLNSGMSYQLNGGGVASVTFPGGDPSTFSAANVTTGAAWGSKVQTEDTEHYGQVDGEWAVDKGVLDSIKFGARFANHERSVALPQASGCTICDGTTSAPLPTWSGQTYPGNFGKGLGGGVLANVWQLSRNDVVKWADQYDPLQPSDVSEVWTGEMRLKERDSAAYAMANLQGGTFWRGNFGVRLVRTHESSTSNLPADLYPDQTPQGVNNQNGPYVPVTTEHTFANVLPSANLRFDLGKDLVARLSMARVMSRPDYGALVSAVSLDDNLHTGSGGNPDLKPILSTNTDVTLEWYYAPKALLSVGLFYMDMSSYVAYGTIKRDYVDRSHSLVGQPPLVATYTLSVPTNVGATNKGLELGWQQTFGVVGGELNYTYTDGKVSDGTEMVGNSKNTYNVVAFYDDGTFNARLAYTYRSSFLAGLNNASIQHMDNDGDLAASVNWKLNEHLSFTFDALNLNNPKLKYYGTDRSQPLSTYSNGRQFYLGVRMSL
ncbi:MAG: TonB-dependent receptor [Betaproteobacteria bacterium]